MFNKFINFQNIFNLSNNFEADFKQLAEWGAQNLKNFLFNLKVFIKILKFQNCNDYLINNEFDNLDYIFSIIVIY